MAGAGVFRLSADWLFGLDAPEGDWADQLLYFIALAFLVFAILLAVPTIATAVMLRLVGADRIAATVGWGLLGYVAVGYLLRGAHVRLPPDGVLVASFTLTRVVLERRHPPEAPPP